jgi:hypothetical protein
MRRRRVALPTVMSISPTRLVDDPNMVQSRVDFKTALLPFPVKPTSHHQACYDSQNNHNRPRESFDKKTCGVNVRAT